MKISYDYTEFIEELVVEVNYGLLNNDSIIQVLRANKEITKGYRPIIDWYYDDAQMQKILAQDILDTQQEIKEKLLSKKYYAEDKEKLESITVMKCLIEMQEYNRII